MQLLTVISILTVVRSEIYDGEKYFDVSNRLKADCVVSNLVSKYNYLGDRSHDRHGSRCIEWNEVFVATRSSQVNLEESPGERVLHSKCRSLRLKRGTSAVALGSLGPWCYVRSKEDKNVFVASECFEKCSGNPKPKPRRKVAAYGKVISEGNYNYALVDNIEKYYKKYRWGDESYYKGKPSDSSYSAEYYRIRQQIFFGCLGALGLIALWILGCYILKKKAIASRRRRELAIQEMFKEEHLKIPEVISRPAPN